MDIINFRTNIDGKEHNVWIECDDIYYPEFLVKEDKSVVIFDVDGVSITDSDEDYKKFFQITTDEDHNLVVEFKNDIKQIYISPRFTELGGPHWEINIVGE